MPLYALESAFPFSGIFQSQGWSNHGISCFEIDGSDESAKHRFKLSLLKTAVFSDRCSWFYSATGVSTLWFEPKTSPDRKPCLRAAQYRFTGKVSQRALSKKSSEKCSAVQIIYSEASYSPLIWQLFSIITLRKFICTKNMNGSI